LTSLFLTIFKQGGILLTIDLKKEIIECGNTYCKTFQNEINIEKYLLEETGAEEISLEYGTTKTEWDVDIYFKFKEFRKGDIELIKKIFDGIEYTLSEDTYSYNCNIHIDGKYGE
jgi:hypothetical protein